MSSVGLVNVIVWLQGELLLLVTTKVEVVFLQPVVVSVKVNVAVPASKPVTNPAFVTLALTELLLIQVPPVAGNTVVVLPTKIDAVPLKPTVGSGLTVMVAVDELTASQTPFLIITR